MLQKLLGLLPICRYCIGSV